MKLWLLILLTISLSCHNSLRLLNKRYRVLTYHQQIGVKEQSLNSIVTLHSKNSEFVGEIHVCNNIYCREKGSDTTIAAFDFLTKDAILVQPTHCLGRCNEGPNCRIFTKDGSRVEKSMVRSVDKVVQILEETLGFVANKTSTKVLELNYRGNACLKSGNVDQAIDCYSEALALGDREQEGVLLVMRGTALLQRAYALKLRCKDIVAFANQLIPNFVLLKNIFNLLIYPGCPLWSVTVIMELSMRMNAIYNQLDLSSKWNEIKSQWPESIEGPLSNKGEDLLDKISFVWSSYEISLIMALQDLLKATTLLPSFAQAWQRAADALSECRRYSAAIDYYEVAMQLDQESLQEYLLPVVERLKFTERLINNAQSKGFPVEAVLSLIED